MDLSGMRFTKTHEWARREGDVCTIGITKFAADQLQDITFIKLPTVGTRVSADGPFGEIETVKAVSDLYAPVAGEVVAVNSAVAEVPESLKADPFGSGWLVKIKLDSPAGLDHLLTPGDYEKQVASEAH